MDKATYHLHMDAAYLPPGLMDRMLEQGGFHADDFPHQLQVGGEKMPARHLTKYLYSPTTASSARAECLKLKSWAEEFSFQGLIQCEYVVEEKHWERQRDHAGANDLAEPFKISCRPLTNKKGDQFKQHEIHLEVNKLQSSAAIINVLNKCGMQVLENDQSITFTASGHSREMLKIRKALKRFLSQNGDEITAKLTYEATAFWSLHEVEPETLPMIVEQVRIN